MRRFYALAVLTLGFLLLPLPALAQTSAPAAVGLGTQLLGFVLSPGGVVSLIAVLGTVLGLILGPSVIRRRRLAKGIYHSFHIAEDLHAEMPENATITKVQTALQALDQYMVANGWRELTPGEQALAKLGFSSLHGEDKVAEKLAVAAAQAGAQAAMPAVAVAVASPQ